MPLVSRRHGLAARDAIAVADLEGAELISFQPGGPHHRVMERFLAGARPPPRVRCVVRFVETAVALADQGMGIALVDSFTAMGPLGDGLVAKRLTGTPRFDVFVHWNMGGPQSQHVPTLRHALRNRLKGHAPKA